jgi:hypothetical protein
LRTSSPLRMTESRQLLFHHGIDRGVELVVVLVFRDLSFRL